MVVFWSTCKSSSILAISKTHSSLTKVGARPKLMGSRITGAVSRVPVEILHPLTGLIKWPLAPNEDNFRGPAIHDGMILACGFDNS